VLGKLGDQGPGVGQAVAGSISNSSQILVVTISSSGVTPSAACHSSAAVSFRLYSAESLPDMIMNSSPIWRAATLWLRAM
jgi:hypothetical protein